MQQVNTLLLLVIFFTPLANASDELKECMSEKCVKMFKNFKKYARHDMPVAMEALGNFYMNGYGVKQNFKKALKYYEHTAKYGSATAQYKTGLMYILGIAGEKKIKRGLTWLRWSVKNGNGEAAYYLAAMYIKGEVVEKNVEEAERWLKISSDNGHKKSQFLLGQLYETGSLGEEKKTQGVELYNASVFEVEGAKERLIALKEPIPQQVDDEIEHIEVNPLPFFEMLGLKLAGLKNYQTPGLESGSRVISPSCRNAKINCGRVNVISDPGSVKRFVYDTQHQFDNAQTSRLR